MNKATELRLKPNAATQASLPLTDNISGDIRKTIDTGLLFVWRKNQPTGIISDWEQITNEGANSVVNEKPKGAINGINVEYILTNTPIVGTVQVFLCGLLQTPGSGCDYIISGNIITFIVAPEIDMEIRVIYDM